MYFDTGLKGRSTRRARKRSLDPNYDFFMPSITKGLLLNVPMRFNNEILYSAGGQTALSTETVSDKGTHQNWKTGLIQQAVTDVARTGPRGWTLEGTRKNECLQSEALKTAPWIQANIDVTENAIVAPDGQLTGNKLADSCAGSRVQQPFAGGLLTDNLQYTISVFVKAGDTPDFSIYLRDDTAGVMRSRIDFQWTAGVPSVKAEDTGTGRVTPYPGGWYRVEATCPVNVIVGANAHGVRIYPTEDGAGATGLYMYAWGVQLEEGDTASSYIPTVAASVERAIDNLQFDNTSEVHLSKTAGTVFFSYTPDQITALAALFSATASVNDRLDLWTDTNGKPTFFLRSGGVTQASLTATSALVVGTPVDIAAVWQTNDVRLYVDGGDEKADAAAVMPASINSAIRIGNFMALASTPTCGSFRHSMVYNRAFSAGQVAQVIRDIQRMRAA